MHASSASLEHRRLLDEERHRAKQDHDRLVEELARVGAALDASKAEVLSLSHARHAQDAALRQAERDLAEAGVRLESARAAAASATAALKADVAAAVENSHRLEQALASAASRARAAEAVLDEERTGRRGGGCGGAPPPQGQGAPRGWGYCAAFSVRLFLPSWGCPSTFFNSWSCWLVLAHRNFTPNWN
jgi:membrane protein involved in colicin uptake